MFEQYSLTLIALALMLFTMFMQSTIAMVAHRKQSHYVPGVVDENLGHDSFVFRSHRTFLNSLENVPLMALTILTSMFVGMTPTSLAAFTWVFVIARLLHMVLYYAIATEKNPSPRSYFFAIGFFANFGLLINLGLTLI
ncbi:MAPEG family protein [Ferrimonas aestuarii]|uniref:MAPEG family protein n=1 Tax=Ferrimonas aestuarii TaxID=2569539 RepID=A0A4U1BNK2_9GAMM|nr:MAPEG family protein [Ferrimonas aestuarii]TKB55503.1 MAPEG family protein [Ferrimonas aestuarii]